MDQEAAPEKKKSREKGLDYFRSFAVFISIEEAKLSRNNKRHNFHIKERGRVY